MTAPVDLTANLEAINAAWFIHQRVRNTPEITTRGLWEIHRCAIDHAPFLDGLALAETAGIIIGNDEAWTAHRPMVVRFLAEEGGWWPTRSLPVGLRSVKRLHALAQLGVIESRGGGRVRLEWRAR